MEVEKYARVEKTIPTPINKEQQVQIKNRRQIDVTGVKQIDSFDSETFLLDTVLGFLIIRGSGLQLKNLNVDEGIVQINGQVKELSYVDESVAEEQKGFFSRLFS